MQDPPNGDFARSVAPTNAPHPHSRFGRTRIRSTLPHVYSRVLRVSRRD